MSETGAPIRITAERLRWLEACEAMLKQIGAAERRKNDKGEPWETNCHFATRLQRMARQPVTYGVDPTKAEP